MIAEKSKQPSKRNQRKEHESLKIKTQFQNVALLLLLIEQYYDEN